MNWNQLEYVVVTAEEKNITRAAKRLFISQPSLSISLSQLERELGSPVFERQNGGLKLTYTGTLFYEWAKTVLASKQFLNDRLTEIKAGERERIRIGISPHRSTAVTPVLLQKIYGAYPMCEVQLTEKPANELKALLDEDKLDIIVDIPQTDLVTYCNEEIVKEGMCLAVPDSYRKNPPFSDAGEEIELSALQEFGFLMLPEESYFGKASRKALELAGITPRILCECTFSETVRNLVEAQLGIALLPDFFASKTFDSPKIRFYRIAGSNFLRTIAIVYKNERYHSWLFLDVAELIKQSFLEVYKG